MEYRINTDEHILACGYVNGIYTEHAYKCEGLQGRIAIHDGLLVCTYMCV